MACTSPIRAFQTDGGEVVFVERGKIRRELVLPCGQCVSCKLERSRQWAVRCMHENQMHDCSCFVTLTYSDEHITSDWSLYHRHFQLFMKRLRRYLRKPVRFYMCGEYGERTGRPHYHALLFGVHFGDRVHWKNSPSGFPLYKSKVLDDLWRLGGCEIGDVTFESAAYIARYCIKGMNGQEWILDPDTGEMCEREREYTRMSLKPGIGFSWYEKYKSEVYPIDRVVMRGKEMKPPRSYDKLLKLDKSIISDDVEYSRYLKSEMLQNDSTPDRLRARDIVTRARLKLKVRSL